MAYSSQVDAEEYRAYAQAIAVMAQVRMAHANLIAMKDILDVNTQYYNVYAENLRKAEGSRNLAGDLSKLEIDHMRLTTAETEIERYLSLGNYYVSYFRILNTLGIEDLHTASVDQLKKKLEEAKVKAAKELKKAKAEFEAEKKKAAEAEAKKAAKAKKAAEAKKSPEVKKTVAPEIPADPSQAPKNTK